MRFGRLLTAILTIPIGKLECKQVRIESQKKVFSSKNAQI